MKCPNCNREQVVIKMTLKGEALTMRSCSACDLHWWEADDGIVALEGIKERVAFSR